MFKVKSNNYLLKTNIATIIIQYLDFGIEYSFSKRCDFGIINIYPSIVVLFFFHYCKKIEKPHYYNLLF